MTLPGDNVSVWKRDNSVKEVHSMKSMVRMPRSSHCLSSPIKGMWGLGGESGVNRATRSLQVGVNIGDREMGKPLEASEYKKHIYPKKTLTENSLKLWKYNLGYLEEMPHMSLLSYSSLGILQKDDLEVARFLAWVGVIICVFFCRNTHTIRVFTPILGWVFLCGHPHQQDHNTTHTCSHNCTSTPVSLSLPCRKGGSGYKPEETEMGLCWASTTKRREQLLWNVKAYLENTAYALPQPFPSPAPCLMLWSAGNFLKVGDGLGIPLSCQQLTCLGVQGGPSHPGTQWVHPGAAEPGG